MVNCNTKNTSHNLVYSTFLFKRLKDKKLEMFILYRPNTYRPNAVSVEQDHVQTFIHRVREKRGHIILGITLTNLDTVS